MATLVDTCILLRAFDRRSPDHGPIRQALRKSLDDEERLVVSIQNVAEFWNVATRPLAQNGQGLSSERVKRRLTVIERVYGVLSEDRQSYAVWKRLVEKLGISGVAVHDARLAAVMVVGGLTRILTLNARDFRRYEPEGLVVVTPESILAASTDN